MVNLLSSHGASLSLQVLQGRPASSDFCRVLRTRHNDAHADCFLQDSDLLLEHRLNRFHHLAITSEANLVLGVVGLLRASISNEAQKLDSQCNESGLSEGLARPTAAHDHVTQSLPALTDEFAMLQA